MSGFARIRGTVTCDELLTRSSEYKAEVLKQLLPPVSYKRQPPFNYNSHVIPPRLAGFYDLYKSQLLSAPR
ncbi:MAG TPA: hypothetical protein VF511_05710, partial [Chthoniobacterales bacterium]